MPEQLFLSLSVVIGIVLIALGVMKILKQPMIIGYILAGILITIFFPKILNGGSEFQSFANIGISFLLFIVGMELNPSIIKDLGKTSLIAGCFQVIVTTLIGFGISLLLGFDSITSIYIGAGLAFSSTIVVLKLLGDKDEIENTFGRLSIGILIVQDLIVLLLFLILALSKNFGHGNNIIIIGSFFIKALVLGTILFVASKYLIPKITAKIAESQEYLFLFSIGRCMILGSLFYYLGFSMEIGALIAGVTLASSTYRFEMTSRIKPLRDFFVVMFFVILGSQIKFASIIHFWPQIIILSLIVLILKPLITMIILGILGHTKKNNFLAGISLGQISEFSFIFISIGLSTGILKNNNLISIITMVGLITIAISCYFILYGEKIYNFIKPILKFIPGNWNNVYKKEQELNYEIILFGFGKFGSNLFNTISKKYSVFTIDEHPKVISHLKNHNMPCMYGDVGDMDFLEGLNFKKSKMVISTVKKFDENMILLKAMKEMNPHLIVILLSNHVHEAIKLYEQGADYVIVPHYIGAFHTSLMLEEYGLDIHKFMQNKKTQMYALKDTQKERIIEALQV
ncbi:MAG: cation:proton antiporter [Candidatus Absconditabacterales bacterium]